MKKLYEEASVQDIADAIREKTGGAETYRIAQMGAAVRSIPGGDQIAPADFPAYPQPTKPRAGRQTSRPETWPPAVRSRRCRT